ncbi:MAG: UDP-2,3-diacylglucosamine diphosphatase [Bacteroidales bacterium]|nr:UDP-2,3-diacylglucosamine diphosphatase [Bacteroidales bacterium]
MAFYKTIVISDVHLGTKDSKSKELSKFLKYNHCRRLILNGDIVDAWNLQRYGKWTKKDTRVFRRIIQMIERYDTEVIYVRGNHDDFLDKLIPFSFGKIKFVNQFELLQKNMRYLVIHGDIFDMISSRFILLAKIGDIGYKVLLWMSRKRNHQRAIRGLPYQSFSQKIKSSVKLAVGYISDYEQTMTKYARENGFRGVICGHIHEPKNKYIGEIHYLNSGDWVESMSALVEHEDESWEVVYYQDQVHNKFQKMQCSEDFSNETDEDDEDDDKKVEEWDIMKTFV